MKKFLLLALLLPGLAHGHGAPVFFSGSTVKWIPSALQSAGMCKLSSTGVMTSGQADLTTNVTGILPLANGGTNKNATAVNGGLVYSDADSFEITSAGTSGRAVLSGGAGAPTFFAPTAGSVLFSGTSGILQEDNSGFFYDDTNNRVGIGTASPQYRFHVEATADNFSHGMALSHSMGGANSLWRIYPDLSGVFSIANPNQTVAVFSAIPQGQVGIGQATATGAQQLIIQNQVSQTDDHTLVLKNIASQTGDALRQFESDGTTVLSKIDEAGAGTFSNLTDSAMTLGSVLFAGTGGILAQDNASLFFDDANNRLGIGTASPAYALDIVASNSTETLLSLDPVTGTDVDFRFESSTFRIDQGAGSILVAQSGNVNINSAVQPFWKLQTQGASTQTTGATFLNRDTGDPIIAVKNSSSTANNMSGLVFAGNGSTTTEATSAVIGVHESHTGAAETGHLEFWTRNAGTISKKMDIAKDGVVTLAIDLAVTEGGTGASTLTSNGVLLGNGTSAVSATAAGAGGTVLQGVTSSAPAFSATPTLGIAGTTKGTLAFAGNTSGTVTVQPAAAAGTWTLTLPTNDGDANQFLQTDGSGVTSWATAGSSTLSVVTKTADYTVTNSEDVILCNGAAGTPITITMHSAATATSKIYRVKNIGSDTCTIAPNGSDTFDGEESVILPSGGLPKPGVSLISNGSTLWSIF